jgi:hypothetical protein
VFKLPQTQRVTRAQREKYQGRPFHRDESVSLARGVALSNDAIDAVLHRLNGSRTGNDRTTGTWLQLSVNEVTASGAGQEVALFQMKENRDWFLLVSKARSSPQGDLKAYELQVHGEKVAHHLVKALRTTGIQGATRSNAEV